MTRLGAAALVIGTVALAGCDPVSIMAGISASKAIYDVARDVTHETSAAMAAACREWAIQKPVFAQRIADGVVDPARAAKAADFSLWADATCNPNAPAPADPLAGAVWLAGLVGRIDLLTEAKK